MDKSDIASTKPNSKYKDSVFTTLFSSKESLYLKKHRSEVVNVVLTEYDEKLHEETCYAEGMQEGLEKGLQEGMEKGLQEGMEKGLQEGHKKGEEQTTRFFLMFG